MGSISVAPSRDNEPRERTLVLFEVSGQLCAAPANAIQEIVPMAELSHSPGQPPLLEGFLNLKGKAVPVVRLDRLFGWPPSEPGLYSHILVLRSSPPGTGLLADRVLDVSRAPRECFAPIPETGSLNGCSDWEAHIGGRTWHVLSCERILLEGERRRIAELQTRAQERLDLLEAAPG